MKTSILRLAMAVPRYGVAIRQHLQPSRIISQIALRHVPRHLAPAASVAALLPQRLCFQRFISAAAKAKVLERRSSSTIEERVKKIVVEQLGIKLEEVVDSASFVEDLGADSLDTVELIMALEEEFEIEIPDEEAEKITTVRAAVDYVNSIKR